MAGTPSPLLAALDATGSEERKGGLRNACKNDGNRARRQKLAATGPQEELMQPYRPNQAGLQQHHLHHRHHHPHENTDDMPESRWDTKISSPATFASLPASCTQHKVAHSSSGHIGNSIGKNIKSNSRRGVGWNLREGYSDEEYSEEDDTRITHYRLSDDDGDDDGDDDDETADKATWGSSSSVSLSSGSSMTSSSSPLSSPQNKYVKRSSRRTSFLHTFKQVVAAVVPLVIFVVGPVVILQPMLTPILQALAQEFSLGVSVWANSRFVLLMSIISMVPGFPVLAIIATLGSMLPFGDALLVGTCTRHLSACLSFFVGRRFLRSRKDNFVRKWSHLSTIQRMAEVQPWRITFLSRFIMLPEQLKNYSLGALSVKFCTFFWMALLGDLQGTVFAVLVGSLSSASNLVAEADTNPAMSEESAQLFRNSLSMVGMFTSLAMMVIATLQVKRIHSQCNKTKCGAGYYASYERRRAQSDHDSTLPLQPYRLRRHSL
eukprot:CAMPEP_0171496362 /NCGR_PEP_ID=MMETSP0958-20121227/6662_1 /TAXON_ID=87120 /ORGANISM="Aurantiochytrium limacinum, Strain ATCCMYA-1381" /LENGTH=490 /DNA_ID=CAMNT_0012030461 /DNA_START=258 /DNA_END=1726 /DNA_ORIENTATION=-